MDAVRYKNEGRMRKTCTMVSCIGTIKKFGIQGCVLESLYCER